MSNTAVPAPRNFELVRGDAASFTLTVTFPASAVSVDLNDYDVTLSCKRAFTDADADAVFQLTKGSGITVDDVNLKVAHIVLDASATDGVDCPPPLNRTALVYDVEIVGPDDKPYTIARGTLTIVADTSRDDA